MSPPLELAEASVRRGRRQVLARVSLAVEPGEMLGVVGPNGAGKSTLLRAALGLQRLVAGEARLAGRPPGALSGRERARAAGYLPQERRVAWNMPAADVVALGAPDLAPGEAHALALACLAELEIAPLARRGVLEMSGGERARVLLARLLATRARLLVADEPAAGLDPEAQILMLERLRARAEAGASVIVTSHDLTAAARACDRLAVLHEARLAALAAPAEALTPAILAEVFALEGALIPSPAGPTLAARRLQTPRPGERGEVDGRREPSGG